MNVSLLTPQKIVFQGEASEVEINAYKGQLGILDRHADIITEVKAGTLKLKDSSQTKKEFEVHDGVLRIENSNCYILCLEAHPK